MDVSDILPVCQCCNQWPSCDRWAGGGVDSQGHSSTTEVGRSFIAVSPGTDPDACSAKFGGLDERRCAGICILDRLLDRYGVPGLVLRQPVTIPGQWWIQDMPSGPLSKQSDE